MIYLRERGACRHIGETEEVAGIVDDLIAHPEKIQAMKKNMAEIAKPRAIAGYCRSAGRTRQQARGEISGELWQRRSITIFHRKKALFRRRTEAR